MTPDNLNLEELRRAWMVMGESLGMNPPHNDPRDLEHKKTALDRLRMKYRAFWTLSLVMMFVSFMFFSRGSIVENKWNFYLGLVYAVYFLTIFVMDHWLWAGIGTIDPLRMGVAEVARKALFYKKRHIQFVAFLIPVAIAVLIFTAYVFSGDVYFIRGIITGALVGIAIGVMQFRKFMACYRVLSE